tara:strand:- start:80 stop:361 length:282 start_codon:yes stop_codon:yes gene_type:complete
MDQIYLSVVLNWHNIENDISIMEALNMENNTTCIKYKEEYGNIEDKYIQAYVLTQYLILYCIVCNINKEINDNIIIENNNNEELLNSYTFNST